MGLFGVYLAVVDTIALPPIIIVCLYLFFSKSAFVRSSRFAQHGRCSPPEAAARSGQGMCSSLAGNPASHRAGHCSEALVVARRALGAGNGDFNVFPSLDIEHGSIFIDKRVFSVSVLGRSANCQP